MNILVTRHTYTDKSTIGSLYFEEVFSCFTLEDKDRVLEEDGVKVQNETAIPRGTYPVTIDHSPHFGRDLPHILNVPEFTGIRIHPGNAPKDTDGCILVGLTCTADFVGDSVKAFGPLFDRIQQALTAGEAVTITVK